MSRLHNVPVHQADESAREIGKVKIIMRNGVMLDKPEFIAPTVNSLEDRWLVRQRETGQKRKAAKN